MPERQSTYSPRDSLSLWMLSDPVSPALVGVVKLVSDGRGVALEYAPSWLQTGFALSEDLPLHSGLFMPSHKGEVVGAVEDARPDRWGERVIRRFEPSARLSLMEYLLFAGDSRYGALSVSLSADAYAPWPTSPLPMLGDLSAMELVVRKILANESVTEREQRLLRPGISLGGARPKSLIEIDGKPWIVKFSEGEDEDTPLIEHAMMTFARDVGINTAATRAIPVGAKHAVAIERFDRALGRRIHAASAHVVLRAAGEEYGYPQLAQQLRRLSPARSIAQQQEQLFRRMVFNILMDNTDDHEKNHGLLRQPDGTWLLSPAYDMVASLSGLGYQAMLIGKNGTESTLENALSMSTAFGLQLSNAKAIVQDICHRVDGWVAHFHQCGVSKRDIDSLAQYFEAGSLLSQRKQHVGGRLFEVAETPIETHGDDESLAAERPT